VEGGGMSELRRLVVDYRSEAGELVVRCLYRSQDGPNPGTKARGKEVSELVCGGLREALRALEDGAEVVGTSGFTTREDVLLLTASSDALQTVQQVKGA
jgi:hypothetical protein